MSGGHFNHEQYKLINIADEIEHALQDNDDEGAEGRYAFKPETKLRFKEAIDKLNEAFIYAQRIDWFLSGDDGEDSFLERLNNELNKLPKESY